MGSDAKAGWAIGECDAAVREAQERAAVAIRAAEKTDEANWVPHPFAVEPDRIVENFLFRHRLAYSEMSSRQLPVEEAELFRLERRRELSWEVTRVVDWTGMRCARSQPRASFWLIRLFDAPRRREIGRVTVAESGLVNMVGFNGPETFPLGRLIPLEARVAGVLGADRASGQYVYAVGSLGCGAIDPCVAYRSPEGILVQGRTALVRISPQEAPLRFSVELARGMGSEEWEAILSRGEHILSLGGDLAGIGRVVGPGIPWDRRDQR